MPAPPPERMLARLVGIGKIGQNCGVGGMAKISAGLSKNNACPHLHESVWLGTLLKDVRDVAAAVLYSEGPGRSGRC
jgi:hypothetical protein